MCTNILKTLKKFNYKLNNFKSLHKYVYKMDKAYLRHLNNNEQFEISFQYTNPDLRVNRQFNFQRKLDEKVSTFLSRVNVNIEKAINKKKKKKNNSDDDDNSDVTLGAFLTLDNVEVDSETACRQLFQPNSEVILKILDKEYNIIINSPWVESFALPKSILANFPVYPTKFDTVFTEKSASIFTWYKSENKMKWTEIGSGFVYTPTNQEINHYLKITCLPKNDNLEGPIAEAISDVTVDASPGFCPFETRHQFTKEKLTGKEFRVVTYNILADLYCDSDYTRAELFPYCPPYALNIDYRKQLILKELLGYNADIICLQEVDKKIFVHDLEPVFMSLNYGSNFCIKGGQVTEGLTCLYNKNRFKELDTHRIVFGESINTEPLFSDIWNKISTNEKLSERILQRTTTMQAITLDSIENNEILVVANVHLYFHPDADHIRLLQGGLAIKYLENLISKLQQTHTDKRISLIFCGDFNSTPECGIYKLYTTGNVTADCIDFKSNQEEAVTGVNFTQPIKLASACGTPKFTNFTVGFADCLDYIFYETSNLQVKQVIPLPSNEELMENTALPSIVFPSDHVSLVTDLKWP